MAPGHDPLQFQDHTGDLGSGLGLSMSLNPKSERESSLDSPQHH